MKPAPFSFHRPETVAEAIEVVSRLEDAKLLAGGQSLMPMMNFRYVTPANVVDLNRVPELAGITEDGEAVVIGAMTRQRDITESPLVAARCPLLAEALHHVGHVQTRNRGTIGGSLAHLDPAAELPGVLLAHDAVLEVEGPQGPRSIAMSQWTFGYMTPALEAAELLVRIRIPAWPPAHGFAFSEVARRHGDFALAGAGALVRIDGGSDSTLRNRPHRCGRRPGASRNGRSPSHRSCPRPPTGSTRRPEPLSTSRASKTCTRVPRIGERSPR